MSAVDFSRLLSSLPPALRELIEKAGRISQNRGARLYLVGGIVRDLLLRQESCDLDLVVEGDAIALARELSGALQAKLTVYSRFGTARVDLGNLAVDLTAARSETYSKPGALPTIGPGSMKDDLFRRDFTINAMAVCISPDCYGELLDPYGGIDDLNHKLIRILHDRSFTDDATRIWRAVRYEQRLDFAIEPKTLALLLRDLPMLDTITGDRIRYEIECVLKEKLPEKVFGRADELGVLSRLNPSLKGNGWLAEKYAAARKAGIPGISLEGLYLALFIYNLGEEKLQEFIDYLGFSKTISRILQDTIRLKNNLNILEAPGLLPSRVYAALYGFPLTAIAANMLGTGSEQVRTNTRLYLERLCYVKPALTGKDLLKMGIPEGPRIKEILLTLLDARLDGHIATRQDELDTVRKLTSKA